MIKARRSQIDGGRPTDLNGIRAARGGSRATASRSAADVISTRCRVLRFAAGGIGARRPEDEQDTPVVSGWARPGSGSGGGDAGIAEARRTDRPVGGHAASRDRSTGSGVALTRGHRATALDQETRSCQRALEVVNAGL